MDRKIGGLTLRELTGFTLLVLLLLLGLLTAWSMSRQHEKISSMLEESAWLALSGQWQNARKTAETAKADWERRRDFRAALADHTPLEEIDGLFAEMTIFAASEERTEFARTCAALARRMEAMADSHRASWWNILCPVIQG